MSTTHFTNTLTFKQLKTEEEQSQKTLPFQCVTTADFAYFRLHGKGDNIWFDYRYNNEELDSGVPKVQETANNVKTIYGYFNNHYHGYAPENCLQLIEKLGLLSEEQKKAVTKAAVKQPQLGSSL
jgi:uncharacterized protein YecE (DUF72 family)